MDYERELLLTVQRLRGLPDVRLLPAGERFQELLGRMTDRPVPRLRPSAWGDQLWLIGRDVPARDRGALAPQLVELRRSFDLVL
jgi:hypothetical protein